MKNSKLISILSTFSKKDWKAFKKWSRSCYDEKSMGEEIVKILSETKNIRLYQSHNELIAYFQQKKNITGTKGSIANALTLLVEHLEDFLIEKEIKSNRQLKNSILIESYAKRGLTTHFLQVKNDLRQNEMNSLWSNHYQLRAEYNAYFNGFYQNYDESKEGLIRLHESMVNFKKDISDFIQLEMINRNIVLDENWDQEIAKMQNPDLIQTKYTEIFDLVISMRKHNNENAYHELRKIILKDDMENNEIVEILMVHLTSYLNLRFKKGEYHLADDVLAFYRIGITNGYYLTNGKITPRRLLNIVNTACSLKKQKWAQEFVSDFDHLLDTKLRDDIVLLCKAAIHFADEEFDAVSDILNTKRFKNFDLEYRARLLKLQSNVEIEQHNHSYILDEIRSFKFYLKRNESKLNIATVKGTKTLLNYIERIIEKDLNNIKEDLQLEKYIMMGRWLNKTIDKKLNIT